MTDVLLINPPFRINPPFTYNMIDPPRNLTIIAAWLEKAGIDVDILDSAILEMSFDEVRTEIERIKPKVVGISNRSTYNYPMVHRVAEIVKDISAECPVVVGGTYVTWAPEDALNRAPEVDYVIVGEGDISGPELIQALLNGDNPEQVPGVAFRQEDGTPKKTRPSRMVQDLGEIPAPANHLLPIDVYVERKERYILGLTRGCLFKCEYCTSSFQRGAYRIYPLDKMMAEIEWAYEKGFRYFYFYDDIFTVNKKAAGELCDRIVESGMKFAWHCMTRLEYVDPELLGKMAASGCDLIGYGVESSDDDVLKGVSRKNGKSPAEVFEITREAGIRPLAFAIFGLPEATFRTDLNTISYLQKIKPSMVRDFTYKPYPGTPQFLAPEEAGLHVFNWDFSRWSQHDEPIHRTSIMDEHEIIETRMLCSYFFRTKGARLMEGTSYRRARGATLVRTGTGGLMYNSENPPEKRTTDLYQNCLKISAFHYEVLLHCDGYNDVEHISNITSKIFELDIDDATRKVNSIINQCLKRGLVYEMPDLNPALDDHEIDTYMDDKVLTIG